MKWKIALIVAIVVGGIGGSLIKNLPGFVIIAYEKTSYEMRLWVAIFILILFLTVLYFIAVFIRSLITGANRVKGWQGERRWRKARKQTIKGMLSFIEGRWNQSENTMINAAKNSDTKLINYLVAAQSAQHQNSEERRDAYLRMAHKAEPNAKVAIGLTQAQLQLDNLQYEQALATLTDLKVKHANHPYILKLLCITHKKLGDWSAVVELLPSLRKQNVFSQEKLEEIENMSVGGLLDYEANKGELEKFKDAWLRLPSSCRKQQDHIIKYSRHLIQFEQMDEAEKCLKPLFKKAPNEETIRLFGEVNSSDGNKQFVFLENWNNSHPQSPPVIYLVLGKIAFNISLWGKARFYFERSLRVAPSAEGYFMMAKTLLKLEDDELASECYRQGLEHVMCPKPINKTLLLEDGSDDLLSANILPKFEKS